MATGPGVFGNVRVFGFIVKPSGNSQLVITNATLAADGSCFSCPADPICTGIGTCRPFDPNYVVNAADIGKPLSITFLDEVGAVKTLNNGGVPYYVQFLPAGSGRASNGDIPAGGGQCKTLIITPCVSITKECVVPCTPIGQPIRFRGQVCNTAAPIPVSADPSGRANDLVGIVVTDNPAAAITFAATTSLGNPFDTGANNRLRPGECVAYSGSYTPAENPCGPFTDTVSVTAVDSTGRSISNTDPCCSTIDGINYTCTGPRPPVTATCHVVTQPCIDLTKDCRPVNPPCDPTNPRSVRPGEQYTETFTVTNCGDVALRNVRVNDSVAGIIPVTGSASCPQTELAAGASCTISVTLTAPLGNCAPITDRATATGDQVCPPDAQCPSPATVTSAERNCTVVICCQPRICVTKVVACLINTNLCGPFGESATGFKVVSSTTTKLPAFCYMVTVSNCGQVCLTNNQVIDDHFGDLTTDFFTNSSEVFCPGQTRSFTFKTELEFDQINTVNASGQSVANGQTVSDIDTAEVHVLPASIDCTKLVSSPDDVDGNADDSHVQFPCGSGSHLVSYSVVVTNTGQADLANIVITDPALSNFCSIPGPFSLAAGASINFPLCGPMAFECGTGGGGNTNQCANPMLKQAAGCTVLELGGYKVDMTGPPGCVQGDVCIGPLGKLSMSGEQCITGMIKLDTGATFSKSGSGTVGPVIHTNLSAEINAAIAASMDAAALPCTMTIDTLKNGMNITGNGGLNVICVKNVTLNQPIYLNGTASDMFVFNVTGKFALTSHGSILVAGGVTRSHVLYNIIGTGEQVAFSGGGGGANCCNAVVDGTLIALQRKIALSPGLVNGQLIGGRDISIVSGASVRCPPGCTPTSFINTLTVSAEVSALQGGTNAFNACVHDHNGLPITVHHQCSATVECR
jgi:uncharacterized repeat protein (TIGR01451 family)